MSDNYTPIHNEVLLALSKINLAPYEARVLFFVWRYTYGFVDKTTGQRKKVSDISASFIGKGIGIDRRLVFRALEGLKKKGVISRDDKKTGFSKEFMKLMSSVEMTKEEGVVTKMMTGSDKNDDKVVTKMTPNNIKHKENYIKKTITTKVVGKKPENTDITFLMEYLKSKLELPILDESAQTNRRYCYLLLQKLAKTEGFASPKEKVRILIDVTAADIFWSNKITSFKSLFYKSMQIMSSLRSKKHAVTEV